jgi:hypothetical protein
VHGQQGLNQALKATQAGPFKLRRLRQDLVEAYLWVPAHLMSILPKHHSQSSQGTAFCHAVTVAARAEACRHALQALAPGSDTQLDAETLEAVAGSAPSVELPRDQLIGRPLPDVMATVKLQDSKAAARRLIKVRISFTVCPFLHCHIGPQGSPGRLHIGYANLAWAGYRAA